MNDMMETIKTFDGKKLPIRHIPGPEGVRGRNSDNALILEKLGWEPTIRLADGLRVTYTWIKSQLAEVRPPGGAPACLCFIMLPFYANALGRTALSALLLLLKVGNEGPVQQLLPGAWHAHGAHTACLSCRDAQYAGNEGNAAAAACTTGHGKAHTGCYRCSGQSQW